MRGKKTMAFPQLFHHASRVNLDTDDKTLSMRFPNYTRNYRNIREYCRILKSKFNGNSANAKFELRSVLYNVRRKSHSLFITESNEETKKYLKLGVIEGFSIKLLQICRLRLNIIFIENIKLNNKLNP